MVATDRIMSFAEALGITRDNVYFFGPQLAQRLIDAMLTRIATAVADVPENFIESMNRLVRIRLIMIEFAKDDTYDWKSHAVKDIRGFCTILYDAADWYVHLQGRPQTSLDILLELKRTLR